MFNDEGVRSHNQIQGVDANGNLRNIKVSENGEILVQSDSGSDTEKVYKTLYCNVATVGTEEITIGIDKEVSSVKIANYSKTANVNVRVDNKTYIVGSNLILDLSINRTVSIIGLSSTEEEVQVQYLVEGVE